MDERTKAVITQRLTSTTGHLSGLERMVCEDAYCVDLIRQIQVVQAALNEVNVIMLMNYLDDCLLAAVWGNDIAESESMLKEVVRVFRVLKKLNCSIEGEFTTMETKIITVPNISCGGCSHTIEMKLGDMAGVTQVEADQRTHRVTVVWEGPATWEKIQARLQEINYPPEGMIQLN